jgi:hypothetical protein
MRPGGETKRLVVCALDLDRHPCEHLFRKDGKEPLAMIVMDFSIDDGNVWLLGFSEEINCSYC